MLKAGVLERWTLRVWAKPIGELLTLGTCLQGRELEIQLPPSFCVGLLTTGVGGVS